MSKLIISLDAISANYSKLNMMANCGAVVKANGYGLGASQVAEKLSKVGCKFFFVAMLEEGIALRQNLPSHNIFVFHGPEDHEIQEFIKHDLIPVLNNPNQLKLWPKEKPAALQFNTGMTRLGLPIEQVELAKDHNIILLMSHLANAEITKSKKNQTQLEKFKQAAIFFPKAMKSLANSSGIFLGEDFHFDLARPGIALYGGNPTLADNPMKNVVTLTAPIIQIYEITEPSEVGYNGLYVADKGDIVATIPVGYADGILRAISNRGKVYVGNYELPIIGRVSMDLITINLKNLPPEKRNLGQEVEVLGENYDICAMANDAGTIEYEVLTRLGNRFDRVYK